MKKFFTENGLTLAFLALFLACLCGQMLSGVASYNKLQIEYGLHAITLSRYVRTGTFLQGMFENWQAAILQLGSLIVLGIFLRQVGAPHSRKAGSSGRTTLITSSSASAEKTSPPAGEERKGSWLHRNSLSVVFFVLFVITFVLHWLAGSAANNAQLALAHQAPVTPIQYATSSTFWFTTFQTWEAEYMAMALYVVLSVYLRQEGSPESKPSGASNSDTSDANH